MSNLSFQAAPLNGAINGNFEEIEKSLIKITDEYEGAIFTEASRITGKACLADLRKLREGIEDTRKQVKKEWMRPYDDFKSRVDGLLQIVDKPISLIDGQLKEMEALRVSRKKSEIKALYDGVIGDMGEFLSLEKIYDAKWENASVKMPTVKKQMLESIRKSYESVSAIKMMASEAVPKALEMYKRDLDLASAIAYVSDYESQRSEILRKEEERRKNDEVERIRREERERMAEEQRIRADAQAEAVREIRAVDLEAAKPLMAPESVTAVYTVVGTPGELEELETAITSLGIYYERKDLDG